MDPNKPVLNSAVIVAFVASLVALLAAFGLPITQEQTEAVLAFIPACWLLALSVWAVAKPKVDDTSNLLARRSYELGAERGKLTGGSVVSRRFVENLTDHRV